MSGVQLQLLVSQPYFLMLLETMKYFYVWGKLGMCSVSTMRFYIWDFGRNLSNKFKFGYIRKIGTLHDDLTTATSREGLTQQALYMMTWQRPLHVKAWHNRHFTWWPDNNHFMWRPVTCVGLNLRYCFYNGGRQCSLWSTNWSEQMTVL